VGIIYFFNFALLKNEAQNLVLWRVPTEPKKVNGLVAQLDTCLPAGREHKFSKLARS
jgi:hypothetical protein